MKKLHILLFVVLAVLIAGCKLSGKSEGPRLVIVHTNDTHSHFDPVRGGELAGQGGVIERAVFIDSVRNANGADKVLLLHAGDFNQGTSYYTEFNGELEVKLINALGYDCITLGNHEFDNGIEDLSARVEKINCPVLCANYEFPGLRLGEIVKPYTIIKKNGLKIGIIGLEAELSTLVSAKTLNALKAFDNAEVVNKYAALLRKQCDIVILLTHIGWEEDLALVPLISGVDAVIGGHSHTTIKMPKEVKDATGKTVPVMTDGYWGREMAILSIY